MPRKLLQSFATRSVFHGPKLAAVSRTRLDAAVWIFVMAICGVLFVGDVSDIFQKYATKEPESSFRLERSAGGVVALQPVICVQFERELFALPFLTFVEQRKSMKGLERAFRHHIQNPDGSDACSVDDVVGSAPEGREHEQPRPLFLATYLLLTYYMDNDLENNLNPRIYTTKMLHLLRLLGECFKRTKVDFVELTSSVSGKICKSLLLSYDDMRHPSYATTDADQGFSQCDAKSAVWLGPQLIENGSSRTDLLCHNYFGRQQVDLTAFAFRHTVAMSFSYVNLFDNVMRTDSTTRSKMVVEIAGQVEADPHGTELRGSRMTFDVAGGAGIMDPGARDKAVSFFPIFQVTSVRMRTHSAFRRYDRPGQPCGQKSRFECAKRCKATAIYEVRNCWPLSFFAARDDVYANTEACTAESDKFVNWTVNAKSWKACLNECPAGCDEQIYELSCTVENAMYVQYWSRLSIIPEAVPFPLLTERLKLDFVGLFAAIGGSSGLWLGGSLFALVQLVTFPIQYLIRGRKPKETGEAQINTSPTETLLFKRLWSPLLSFCRRTPLHGVSFITHREISNSSSGSVVWLIVCSIFGLMTIRDTSLLIDKYCAEPTKLNASITFDETVSVDRLALCCHAGFEKRTAEFAYYHETWDASIDETVANFSAEPTALTDLRVGRNPVEVAAKITPSILWLMYIDLLSVASTDMGCVLRRERFEAIYTNWGARTVNRTTDVLRRLEGHLRSFRSILRQQNITYRELGEFFGLLICRYRNVSFAIRRFDEDLGTYLPDEVSDSAEICRPDRLRWFTDCPRESANVEVRICYRLPPVDFLPSARDVIRIAYDFREDEEVYKSLTVDASIDVRGGSGAADVTLSDAFARDGSLFVSVSSEFRIENRSADPCALSSSGHRDCTDRCHFEAIRMARNCSPMAYAHLAAGRTSAKFCNRHVDLTKASRNSDVSFEASLLARCADECKRPCDVRLYRLERHAPSEYSLACHYNPYGCNERHKEVNVSLRRRPFLRVEEQLSMSIGDALISVGGAIALWFGASVLAVLHVPLHVLFAIAWRADKPKVAKSAITISVAAAPSIHKPVEESKTISSEAVANGTAALDQVNENSGAETLQRGMNNGTEEDLCQTHQIEEIAAPRVDNRPRRMAWDVNRSKQEPAIARQESGPRVAPAQPIFMVPQISARAADCLEIVHETTKDDSELTLTMPNAVPLTSLN